MAFILNEKNGVSYFSSDLLGCRHGFSTRLGGVSTLPHTSSLNLAFGRGDDEPTVLKNLELFSDAVGIDSRSIVSRTQIHSKIVSIVDKSNCGEGYYKKTDIECDGYVTDKPRVALGIKTADCVPILFHDPKAGIIGAVHAGWRGTASKIVTECIEKMRELGANPCDIRAAIGAAIGFCCYEVGEDFYESVASLVGKGMVDEFIRTKNGRLHADIVRMNERLLLLSGIDESHIDISPHCTCHEPELFYSHRASGGIRGTMLSVISL